MKIKGKVVDYALLIAVGVGLIWCAYEVLIVPETSHYVLIVLILAFIIYVITLPKRNRQIQSYEQTPKETDPVDVVERVQRIEEKYVQAEIDRLTGRAEG